MRHIVPILIIAFLAAVVYVANLADTLYGWLIVGFCFILGAVGWAAAERERRAEHYEVRHGAIQEAISFLEASDEGKSEQPFAD